MILRIFLFFLFSIWFARSASAQNYTQTITAIQYYFDIDPGVNEVGNGAILPVSPTSNYDETVSITVPGSLSIGFHNLYVRVQDEFGSWSLPERRLFYINTAISTAIQDIKAYQYYFDTDPGVGVAGNGAIVPVTLTGNYNASVSITVPNSLANGFHNLYVRTQDVLGRWSLIERRLFYINTSISTVIQDITAYQYFFDTDPGVGVSGNGAIVPVTQTDNYNESVSIAVPNSLTNGFHNLYVRTKDALGRWSLIERRLFYINTSISTAIQDIKAYQYYFDTDPGVGVAGNGDIVPVTQTDNYNASVSITVPNSLPTGFHNLYVRTQDVLGRWSLIERRLFYINTSISTVIQDIKAYQYYFDTDPGVGVSGNGGIVPVTQTDNFNASVSITVPNSLTSGFHNLYVRTQDVLGRWSLIERRLFYINTATSIQIQDISALEFYYDNDPGVGNGNSIPITTSANINATFAVNVPCLSSGQHFLFIRAKDVLGRWSIIEKDTVIITSGISAAVVTPTGPVNICANDSIKLSADSVPGLSYQWLRNGIEITDANKRSYFAHIAGNYSLKTTCGSSFITSNVVVVNIVPLLTFYADTDGDGFGNLNSTTEACSAPSGFVANNTDCDDTKNSINPNAPETCNGFDDDCDGQIDEGVKTLFYADADIDGFGDPANFILACIQPSGFVSNNGDCNDTNIAIHPGVSEICDLVDNNCNGQVDENFIQTINLRSGNGSIGDDDAKVRRLLGPGGSPFPDVFTPSDFAAARSGIGVKIIPNHPAWIASLAADPQAKWINNIFHNQQGQTCLYSIDFEIENAFDEAQINFYYAVDNHLGGGPNQGLYLNGQALSGSTSGGDYLSQFSFFRNDIAPLLHQGTNTLYVNSSNEGGPTGVIFSATISLTSENSPATWYADEDGDGYGNLNLDSISCTQPVGYISDNTDCNDASNTIHPGATEITGNGIDEDCSGGDALFASALNFDGVNDEIIVSNNAHFFEHPSFTFECWVKKDNIVSPAVKDRLMVSQDDGGWGVAFNPDGTILLSLVGSSEVNSTGKITNTNWHHIAVTHDGTTAKFYIDGNAAGTVFYPVAFSSAGNYSIGNRQGRNEFLDGNMDEVRVWKTVRAQSEILSQMNCEINFLHTALIANYHFNHGVAFANNSGINTLINSSGNINNGSLVNFALNGTFSNWITPGGVTTGIFCSPCIPVQEICNGIDDDCDGLIDDADPNITGQPNWYIDSDGDGFGNAAISVHKCVKPTGYVSNSTDCDDTNNQIHPGENPGIISGSSSLCINATETFSSSGVVGGVWSSSNINVASVNSSSGLVTAISAGVTTIKYTVTGCNISVFSSKNLTINPNASPGIVSGLPQVCIGSSIIYLSNGNSGGSWSSSDETVATVNPLSGLINGLSSGNIIISYTVTGCGGTFSATKNLIVSAPVSSGIISGNSLLCIAETITYSSNGTSGGAWSSSNTNVATINNLSGLVTAISAGTTTITYKITGCNGNLSSSRIVTVIPVASAGVIKGPSPICIGAATTFSSTGTSGGSWISSDPSVASIDISSGLVTGISSGSTIITYSITGCGSTFSATRQLTVAGNASVFSFSGNIDFTNSVVSPVTGEPELSYRFEVNYSNVDGAFPSPGFPRMTLDYEGNGIYTDPLDLNIIMSPLNASDLNVIDGKTYFVILTGLPVGSNWMVNFLGRSTGGCETFSSFTGPDITRKPNVSIFADDITFSTNHPSISSQDTVYAVIHNDSSIDVQDIVVHLINQYDNNETYPDIIVPLIEANSSVSVSWPIITPALAAWVPMQVVIDFTDVVEENNELDNQAIRPFTNGNFIVPGNIKVTASGASTSCQNAGYTVCGNAKYQNTAVVLQNPSVAGASISATLLETGQQFSGFTNSQGNYCISFASPDVLGTYTIDISITDFTLTGNKTTTFTVINCPEPPPPVGPDLVSKISLDAGELFAGNPITGSVMVKNNGNRPADASTADVYLTSTGIGSALHLPMPALAPGEFHSEPFSLISPVSLGIEGINSYADGSFVVSEIDESNNDDHAQIKFCHTEPDLIAGGYSREGTPGIFLCEDSVRFSVSNISCLPVNSSFDVQLQIFQNGSLIYNMVKTMPSLLPRDASFSIPFYDVFPSSGIYYLVFSADINNTIVEFDETNNIFSTPFSVTDCKPEVFLSYDCNPVLPVDPAIPGNIIVHTLLRNTGKLIAVAPFIVDFEVAGNHYPVTISQDMPVDASLPLAVTIPTPPYGCPVVTATADATNVLDEFGEDNSIVIDLSWDFSLWRICYEFDPEDPKPNPNFWEEPHNVGSPVTMGVGLVNYSNYFASVVRVRYEVTGPGIPGWLDLGSATATNVGHTCSICKSTMEISPLELQLPNFFVFPQVGIYQVRLTADGDSSYIECNENNNVMIVDVTITNSPDYRTLSKFIAPSLLNPEVGQPITFDVTYENIGATNIVDSLDIFVRVDNLAHQTVRAKGLFNGVKFTAHFSNPWSSLLPGLHVVRAITDYHHQIPESNESNNEATRSFVVGKAADLYFQVFAPDNSFPLLGQAISIKARIGNRGALYSEGDVKFFYLDELLDSILIGTIHINVPRGDSIDITLPWTVLDNSTLLIGKITNMNILQLRYDDKEATAELGNFDVSITSKPACFGGDDGKLTANPIGGIPPYNFKWNTGATSAILIAPPGNYSLTIIDAAGSIRVKSEKIKGIPPPSFYEDADGDGFGNPNSITEECEKPSGYVDDNTDCNDSKSSIHPGAIEICNGIDDNCNGEIDEGVKLIFFVDEDADGFGNADVFVEGCTKPAGYVLNSNDCNDTRITAHPGAAEVCNGIDDNCNGDIDEGVSTTYYRDADGDGFGNINATTEECSTPEGFVANNTDCNDNNKFIHPGVAETCNGIDDNCNGQIDEGVLLTFYSDADTDGFGNPDVTIKACSVPGGFVINNTDCNDAATSIHPGATETCNELDDNCNGQIDEGVKLTFYRDSDGDGFGNPAFTTLACSPPNGFITNNTDCNDAISFVHPGATEVCNGIDDNCNGQIDEGVLSTFYRDADGDGFGNPAITSLACSLPSGFVSNNNDCNDANTLIHPGAAEMCNGIDDNCNGQIDEGVLLTFYRDADTDGFGNPNVTTQACSVPSGFVITNTDCNDANILIHPGAPELCNGKDDNCNGQIDDGVLQVYVDDGNVCTTDGCDAFKGEATHIPVNTDDGNACTTDVCNSSSGVSHTAINVNDNNPCTTDACDSRSGNISHADNSQIVTATAGIISCYGGTTCVTVTAVGGLPPYTSGTGEICGFAVGNYSFDVRDSRGCVATSVSYSINQPPKLQVTTSSTPSSGNDGTATATPNGGTQGYNYLWTPGNNISGTVTGLSSGNYCVKVTDANGCTTASCTTVLSACNLSAPEFITGPTGLCKKQTGIVYCVPVNPLATSYIWVLPKGLTVVGSPIGPCITLKVSTKFKGGFICAKAVTPCGITLSACLNVVSITKRHTTPGIIAGPDVLCPLGYGTYSIIPIFTTIIYEWSVSSNMSIISGQGTTSVVVQAHSNFKNGEVKVKAKNCKSSSGNRNKHVVDCDVTGQAVSRESNPIGVTEGLSDLNVYPNPTHDKLNIEFISEKHEECILQLTDVTGRVVKNKIVNMSKGNNLVELYLDDFLEGIYILSVINSEGKSQIKVMIE